MPTAVFVQHHILLNLKEEAHRLENWRAGMHRDFIYNLHEVIVTPAGIESGWRWHARSKVIVVTIDPDRLGRFVKSELGLILTDRQLKDVPLAHDPDLVLAASMLVDALRIRAAGSEVIFESLARVFLVKLIQTYGEERSGAAAYEHGLSPDQHARVLNYVSRCFGSNVTIEALAREAGLSPSHFSRIFHRTLGETPYQFVMEYRVEQARKMLADRSLALIEIALRCGFSDQPHFSRIFKRLTGQTPKEYRQAL